MFCKTKLFFFLLALVVAYSSNAVSADYPTKPIQLVVPYPPGYADSIGRILAESMSKSLGQPVVVQNRSGANGSIGSESVARAANDGYTLLLSTISTMTINPFIYKNLGFDTVKDFVPISLLVDTANVIVVHPKSGINTLKDLIEKARANPGELTFGSSGNGSTIHLSGELFKQMTGVDMVHVPYKGGAAALLDLLGGRLTTMFSDTSAFRHIQAGRLVPLAVTSAKRLDALPNVPTVSEAGIPGYVVEAWFGLVAPKGTPKEIVARLNGAIVQALQEPESRKKLVAIGAKPVQDTSSEHFGKVIEADVAKWSRVIKDANITID